MSDLKEIDVRKTQEIVRKLNLKVTGWQFARLVSEIALIRKEAKEERSVEIGSEMFDQCLKGMFADMQEQTKKDA